MKKLRIVPELRHKYSLLVNAGHFHERREIAEALGRSLKTIESWHDNGSDGFTPGLVSAQSYRKLIDLFTNAIGKYHKIEPSEVEALLLGSAKDIAPYLHIGGKDSLLGLFIREAIPDAGRVITPKKALVFKVPGEDEPRASDKLRLGLSFRIVFKTEFDWSNTLALQHWHQDWGFVESCFNGEYSQVTLPDTTVSGSRGLITEDDWVGQNMFLVLHTSASIPPEIAEAMRYETKPDLAILKQISDFVMGQPRDQRSLYMMRIEFIEVKSEPVDLELSVRSVGSAVRAGSTSASASDEPHEE